MCKYHRISVVALLQLKKKLAKWPKNMSLPMITHAKLEKIQPNTETWQIQKAQPNIENLKCCKSQRTQCFPGNILFYTKFHCVLCDFSIFVLSLCSNWTLLYCQIVDVFFCVFARVSISCSVFLEPTHIPLCERCLVIVSSVWSPLLGSITVCNEADPLSTNSLKHKALIFLSILLLLFPLLFFPCFLLLLSTETHRWAIWSCPEINLA